MVYIKALNKITAENEKRGGDCLHDVYGSQNLFSSSRQVAPMSDAQGNSGEQKHSQTTDNEIFSEKENCTPHEAVGFHLCLKHE